MDRFVDCCYNKQIQHQEKGGVLGSMTLLKDQVNKTSIIEMQTIFFQLTEGQAKTLMLAEISDEYALKTFSAAYQQC